MKRTTILTIMAIMLIGIASAQIITTSIKKEITLKNETIYDLKEIGIQEELTTTECQIIDDKYCKFMIREQALLFEDYLPNLQYIEYHGKTKEEINKEMRSNTEELLKYIAEEIRLRKLAEEQKETYSTISDNLTIEIKNEIK